MLPLVSLFLVSTLFIFLLRKIWHRTHEFTFILGFLLMYYWLVLGSWFVVADQYFNAHCENIGLQYYGIAQKLFPVSLDHHYLLSILLHGSFILSTQLFLLWFLKKKKSNQVSFSPIPIAHSILLLAALSSIIFSFLIVKNDILFAVENNMSIYSVTRSHTISLFSFHQLFNQVAVFSIFSGLALFLSRKKSVLFLSPQRSWFYWLYLPVGVLVFSYLMLLGNKNEFLFSGLFSLALLYINGGRKIDIYKSAFMVLIILIPLVLNHYFRVMGSHIVQQVFAIEPSITPNNTGVSHASSGFAATIASFVFSNEMFYAQFSMYGILHYDLPFIWGQSLYSLFASFIPSFIIPVRPLSAYEFYVAGVNASAGQGYTISHAAAWYLNFGWMGVFFGAFSLAALWGYFYQKDFASSMANRRFLKIISRFLPLSVFAFIPAIMRSGPEVYKAFLFEALLIPSFLFFIASMSIWKIFQKKKNS